MNLQSAPKEVLIDYIRQLEQEVAFLKKDPEGIYKELQRTNAALLDLFDNAHDLIFVISRSGEFLFYNRACREKLGYTQEELQKLRIQDLIHPQYKHETYQQVFAQAREGAPYRLPFHTALMHKSGKVVYLEGHISLRYEQSRIAAIRGILYDVTDRVKAEQAQNLYNSIARLAIESDSMRELFRNIHIELSKVMEVENFYITLYHPEENTLTYPYYVDQYAPENALAGRRPIGKGLVEYALRQARLVVLNKHKIEALIEEGELALSNRQMVPLVWVGIPLRTKKGTLGVLSLKSYRNPHAYTQQDLKLLEFISGQVAVAAERKQTEMQLRNQTARLRAIFESGSHIMWTVNRKRQFTSFNQNYVRTLQEQYGITPKLYEYPKELKELMRQEQVDLFWKEKFKQAFEGKALHFEMTVKDLKGNVRWREIYLNPIPNDEGEIEEVSAIAHDITEKKLSEIALKESEEKFRTIFESFQDIYYRSDLKGRILMISPSIKELGGYEPEELIGKPVTSFYTRNIDKRSAFRAIRELMRKGRLKNFEIGLRRKDGTEVESISNIRLLYNEQGKPYGIEGVVRDITELKRASEEVMRAKELAEHSLRVKENFLANMSHEIRTPMNGIIGMIDLLDSTPLSPEQREYVNILKESSETLLNILNDILDLSKIEAGKMQLRPRACSVHSIVERVHHLFLPRAHHRGNQLRFRIDEGVPPYVVADETRLVQVLSNLVNNAIKFTEQGSIDIVVKVLEEQKQQLTLYFEVKDTGIGIAPEDQKKLFRTFSQLDTSTKKAYAGTGLGLAIAKQLVELMGGSIGLHSTPGQGSRFFFTIRVRKHNQPLATQHQDPMHRLYDILKKRRPRLLVVDDNAVNRKVAAEILRRAYCHVQLAEDARKALELVQSQDFDLILMDIQMPEIDGIEATQMMRDLRHDLPPIVAMTAYAMPEDRQRFLQLGMDDYIAKPLRAQQLLQKVVDLTTLSPPAPEEKGAPRQALPTPQGTHLPVLDEEVLEQLSKYGGKAIVQASLTEFIEESQGMLDDCFRLLKQEDYEGIRKLLHTLKGTSGTLGAARFAQAVTETETLMKKEVPQDLKERLLLFVDLLQQVRDACRKRFGLQ
ncbi:MAG: hypothetical protein KatS3mg033_1106 [Thermonema sp.]|uniref:PAS domain S-box protein n=1 Tax=Thermonema sp. TaxID=2231181 RepID=UPI0021DCB9AF|nr:PAS domain S-box protein [Thermonema sp.]GIV39306.1 MAG: hypothetical protein KatS3mg033_1106 [Thermonema sp.]